MKRSQHIIIAFLAGLIISFVLLHFFGKTMELSIRTTYRKHICNCDTARAITIIKENGVPVINYHSINGKYIGIQTNPSTIALHAINYFADDNELAKKQFFNCISALEKLEDYRDSSIFFNYNYDWVLGMNLPWNSAMAQGNILTAYTMAFKFSGDSTYLQKAKLILNSFLIPVERSGVSHFLSENEYWYEEYAHPQGENPMVLNGMMYALRGIHYYQLQTNDSLAKQLFEKGLKALENNLYKYEHSERSMYDLKGNVANDYYHNVHVEFLEQLYKATEIEKLNEYAIKWGAYNPESYIKSLFSKPNKSSLLLVAVLWFFTALPFYLFLQKRK